MAYTPQINERIFQQTSQQTPPPRPTYLPGRVVNSPDDIRASEIPMDGTVAVFPSSDYSHSDLISVNCCDFDRLTVTNTGAVPVVISTNPLLYIKRVS